VHALILGRAITGIAAFSNWAWILGASPRMTATRQMRGWHLLVRHPPPDPGSHDIPSIPLPALPNFTFGVLTRQAVANYIY